MATGLPRFLPRMIAKGTKGKDVLAVQQALIANGYKVKADGVFGGGTQVAIRTFQVHKGLPPSGVIDQATIDCLHAESASPRNAAHRLYTKPTFYDPVLSDIWRQASAMALAPAFWGRSFAPAILNVSGKGIDFIFRLEAGKGTGESKSLHWPGGNSGVTLGPGYDMKEREQADVERDLKAINVDAATAAVWSQGAKVADPRKIKPFINAHKQRLSLSVAQQKELLKICVPEKEAIIRRLITIDLFQFEYDALVSMAYNAGGSLVSFACHINSGETGKAMKIMASRIYSDGKILQGLIHRRKAEIALYTHGSY